MFQYKIGAHVSISGGLDKIIPRTKKIGANTIQIFASAPQNWKTNTYSDIELDNFKKGLRKENITPVFVHAIYLINLASKNPSLCQKSIDSLVFAMFFAKKIGALGVILHIGSHLGMGLSNVMEKVVSAGKIILEKTPKETFFIIENSAGSGSVIGKNFNEIASIMEKLSDQRIKVCLDTAHALASGYQVNTKDGLEKTLDNFEKTIGLENLVAIHANDSKVPLGKGADRHENIGRGFIGLPGFRLMLNHPKLRNLPFIIETPGFKNEGPDSKNIQILQSLVE